MFTVPEHVQPVRDRVRRFIEAEIEPHEQELADLPPGIGPRIRDLREKAKSAGVYALGHPEQYGGGGLTFYEYAFINEVIGRCELAIPVLGSNTVHTALMIDKHGSQTWKDRLLRRMAAGDVEVAFSVSEREVASSDPLELRTTATLEDGEWVITGSKWYVSLLEQSEWVTVMCRTDGDDVPPHRRFSVLIVPTDAPGLRVIRPLHTLALRGANSGHYELELDHVRVPEDHLIGERGNGFTIAQDRLGPGRIYHCMRWLGVAQRAFDLMCLRANSRTLGGTPLADRQLVQQMVFDSYHEISAARLLVLDAAEKIDAGQQARNEISVIKVVCARMVHAVVDRAMQVHGALGMTDLTPLERMYRNARTGRIMDGPDETHIQRVGRRLLRHFEERTTYEFDASPRREPDVNVAGTEDHPVNAPWSE